MAAAYIIIYMIRYSPIVRALSRKKATLTSFMKM